jgi:hypothetical protein
LATKFGISVERRIPSPTQAADRFPEAITEHIALLRAIRSIADSGMLPDMP